MSEVGDIQKLLDQLPKMLDDLRRQSLLFRILVAVFLLGSAALAVWVNPTTAIVCAALAVAAVWLVLPSVRNRIFVEATALRDRSGKTRLAAVVTKDGMPMIILRDTNDKQRAMFGLTPNGSPLLALFDEQQKPRLVESFIAGAPSLMFWDEHQATKAELIAGDTPNLHLADVNAQGNAELTPTGLQVQQSNKLAFVGADGDKAGLICTSGTATTKLSADERGASFIASKGEYGVVVRAIDEEAVMTASDGSAIAAAIVDSKGSRLKAGTPDTYAELQRYGSTVGLVASNGQAQLAAAVTDGTADVVVSDRKGIRKSLVEALGTQHVETAHSDGR